jgi:hypothetical protein
MIRISLLFLTFELWHQQRFKIPTTVKKLTQLAGSRTTDVNISVHLQCHAVNNTTWRYVTSTLQIYPEYLRQSYKSSNVRKQFSYSQNGKHSKTHSAMDYVDKLRSVVWAYNNSCFFMSYVISFICARRAILKTSLRWVPPPFPDGPAISFTFSRPKVAGKDVTQPVPWQGELGRNAS